MGKWHVFLKICLKKAHIELNRVISSCKNDLHGSPNPLEPGSIMFYADVLRIYADFFGFMLKLTEITKIQRTDLVFVKRETSLDSL